MAKNLIGATYDEEYIKKRVALIPIAEEIAKGKVEAFGKTSEPRPGKDGQMFEWDFFSQYFHEAMTMLSAHI